MAAQGEVFEIDRLAPKRLAPETNGLPHLIWVAGQLGSFPTDLQPPAARYAVPGRVIVITRLNEWSQWDPKRTNVASWIKVAEQLADADVRISEALEALQSPPFSANVDYQAGFSALPNHLGRLKSLAQFLSAAALHDLHQGQRAAALEKLKGLLALVDVGRDEPLLISQLVRIAIFHISFGATWQALQHAGWTDAQLMELQEKLAAFDFLVPMEKAIAMERAMVAIEYERFRSSNLPLSAAFDPTAVVMGTAPSPSLLSWNWVADSFENLPQALYDNLLTPVWRFAWSHHDELYYCQILQRVLVAQREARARNNASFLFERTKAIEERPDGFYDGVRFLLAPMIYTALSRSFHRAWIAQAAAEMAATAIAIKRFDSRHDRLPTGLVELVPEFLARHPRDPMDGGRLKYCADSDATFLLYSIGIDGRDDGGDPKSKSTNPNFQNGHDLVWPQPASEIDTVEWSGRWVKAR